MCANSDPPLHHDSPRHHGVHAPLTHTHVFGSQAVGILGVCEQRLSSVSEAGSYLRLIDACITQHKARGPSRTCNESTEEEDIKGGGGRYLVCANSDRQRQLLAFQVFQTAKLTNFFGGIDFYPAYNQGMKRRLGYLVRANSDSPPHHGVQAPLTHKHIFPARRRWRALLGVLSERGGVAFQRGRMAAAAEGLRTQCQV